MITLPNINKTLASPSPLDSPGEGALSTLGVPFLDPFVGAERLECALEVEAGLVLVAADLLAPVEVEVRLVAMSVGQEQVDK